METDKRKKQGEGDDDGNDEGRAPVEHEQRDEQGYQEDAFHQVVEDGMRSIVDEVFAVIIGDDLGVLREHHRIQLVYLGFDGLYHLCGILAFAHDHDRFHHVVLVDQGADPGGVDRIGSADTTQTGYIGDLDVRDILHQYGDIVVGGNDDVLDLVDIVEQADAAHDI